MVLVVKNPPASTGGVDLIPGLGRSPGTRHGNPPQCSCLENPMDRRTWWTAVHSVAKSWIQPKQLSRDACREIMLDSHCSAMTFLVTFSRSKHINILSPHF